MGYKFMSEQRDQISTEQEQKSWYATDTKNTAGNGNWILKPNGTNGIGVTLSVTAGSGYVEATTDSVDSIIAGTAVGVRWPLGVVTGVAQDYAQFVSAVRLVNTSGTTTISVVAD